ncbi:GH92 family glycosyl hydrolase [Gaoshiqia sp. Z1-71]|uniref:GH92 family glycosyl hydrolase n=1 Tax=Gaoshiqia hydrogeniformans TaxID=3290090 RepID=UPI003BF80828
MNAARVKSIFIPALLFLLATGCTNRQSEKTNLRYVDPTIGNVGHLLVPTRPTVHLPNQLIRMHPVRADYLDDQISFFPLTIISHRKGELFGVLPGSGEANTESWKKRQTYDHGLEVIKPYYYSTYLIDEDIRVEFVPGSKTGLYRFTFPEKSKQTLRFQINHEGRWKVISKRSFAGEEQFYGMKAFVYGEFDREAESLEEAEPAVNTGAKQAAPVMWAQFNSNEPVGFSYAVSFISDEQAKANFENEIRNPDFESFKNKGEQVWAGKMDQIRLKGGTEAQRRTFYSSLYRCYERMVNINEYGRYYSGYDHRVHESDRDFYVDDWVWDTYLAHHPLRMILDPEQEADMLQSYVNMYEQGGWMPQFPLIYQDDPAMNGFHSTIVFLDAWRKGIRSYDMTKAYEGMRKNGYEATMLPWRNGPKCALDSFYRDHGFYPALAPGETETVEAVHDFEKRQSVAITLGHSYDDWALAELAKELGYTDDQAYFGAHAGNYRHLYRQEKKLFSPKNAQGEWIEIDPKFDGGMGGRDYYDENNAYTYQWQVQHDIQGLVQLMGGPENFRANLDQLFRENLGRPKYQFWAKFPDATGLVGQFSMGNEPSFHIPYLYNYVGEPWKTQKRIPGKSLLKY